MKHLISMEVTGNASLSIQQLLNYIAAAMVDAQRDETFSIRNIKLLASTVE